MGVPAFFRWLSKKYPSVIVHCIEEKPREIDGIKVPVNCTVENPNGVEFDNLYLDMNGIIHPCTHPEDKPAPKDEEEMMIAIFECIDRLFRIVRPRKVLYMAIDGVAPRAKMNQQRSRRFRASKEVTEKIKEIERIREELLAKGCELPPAKPKGSHFDSNCITPGTPFMDRLSKCLQFYIHDRLNNDPAWRNIKVILSDANVPGEGEHKIMDYIRKQRSQPDHDPNTAHCLCGADADLMMLGLATHEPNFTIIREEFKPNKPRPCDICGQLGHEMKDCLGVEKECPNDFGAVSCTFSAEVEFIFVRINVLREYLERELTMVNLPFPFDLERAIDDWVFMCFFVGNDFLPHLPSLEIRENAIDRLVTLYKKTVYKTGGYLTDSGVVNLDRVQLIMTDLGRVEDDIFQRRQENELNFRARNKANKKRKKMADANCYSRPSFIPGGQFAPVSIGSNPNRIHGAKQEAHSMRVHGMHTATDGNLAHQSNKSAAASLKAMLRSGEDPPLTPDTSSGSPNSVASSDSESWKRKAPMDSDSEEEPNDEVRLWEDGFKDRYYESKFDVNPENTGFRNEVARQYVLGLCWVLRYYYQGCPSWKWYFPYHYAPFASDFIDIGKLPNDFEKNTKPFSPLEQLMSVFPAASKSHVPEPWGVLMSDPESEIIDFYPEDFQIDLNGKKFAWQGVALLPFVDEVRLKEALKPFYKSLTPDEIKRNIRGDDYLFIHKSHNGYDILQGIYENEFELETELNIDGKIFDGMTGTILVSENVVAQSGVILSPLAALEDQHENQVISVRYRDVKYSEDFIYPAKRLEGAKDPPRVLKPTNLTPEESRNWRPMIGMAHSTTRASIDQSGRRMLERHGFGASGGQSSHNNMPPPIYGSRGFNDSNNRHQPYGNNSRSYGGGGGGGWDGHQQQRSSNNYQGRGGYNSSQGYGGSRHDGRNSRDSGWGGNGGGGGGYGRNNYQQDDSQRRGSYGGQYGYTTVSSDQDGSSSEQIPRNPDSNWRNSRDRDEGNDGGRGRRDGYYTSGYSSRR